MGNKILIIFILFPCLFFTQNHNKTDSLFQKEFLQFLHEGNFQKAIQLNKVTIKKYEKAGFKEGIVKCYINLGNLMTNLGRNKESLEYLNIAQEKIKDIQNYELETRLYGEYAKTYGLLGFGQKALEYYDRAIDIGQHIPAHDRKTELLAYLYACKAGHFENGNQYQLFYHTLHKAYKMVPDPITASRIAKYFLVYAKNMDSATYYLKKAQSMINTGKYPVYQKAIVLRNFGRLYFEKKEYKKAISSYKESLLISEEMNKKQDIRDNYKLLYEAYKEDNDKENAAIYLEKYTVLNDSLVSTQQKSLDTPVNNFLREEDVQKEKTRNTLYWMIFVLWVLLIVLISLYKRSRKRKQKLLLEKENIISLKEEETQRLQLKINESFEQVVQLAKDNSPEFLSRFQEVYPEFTTQLLKVQPELTFSDLSICAMIWLGFTSKEIAYYTFKQHRSVQTKKNRLRKKLNLSAEVDMYSFFRELPVQ